MRGELSIEAVRVEVDLNDKFLNPYDKTAYWSENGRVGLDLRIDDKDGDFLYVCTGKADWAYLLTDAMMPLIKHGLHIMCVINGKLEEDVNDEVDAILLGKNEHRAVDILYRLRHGKNEEIKEIGTIPVVKSKDDNCVQLLKREKKGE